MSRPLDGLMAKKVCQLDNWSLTKRGDAYTAPECQQYALQGKVSDHPEFQDGDLVTVSRAVDVDFDNHVLESLNTVYILGEPNPDFVKFLDERGDSLDDVRNCLLRPPAW